MSANLIFTDHLRDLLDGKTESGDKVLRHLAKAIRTELHRSGFWKLPPSFLGYDGNSWRESNCFEDLVQDAYLVCIFQRLKRLVEYLQAEGTIEGAVHWKLKRFLLDRQRACDPTRLRIFRNVRAASQLLVANGLATAHHDELHTASSPEATRDATSRVDESIDDADQHSATFTAATMVLAPGAFRAAEGVELHDRVSQGLSDSTIVATSVRVSAANQWQLMTWFAARLAAGLSGYSVGDMTNLFVDFARSLHLTSGEERAWRVKNLHVNGSFSDFRMHPPDHRYQVDEDFRDCLSLLEQGIARSRWSSDIQQRITKLLKCLSEQVQEGEDSRKVTQATLARRLNVPYTTLNADFTRLRELISAHPTATATKFTTAKPLPIDNPTITSRRTLTGSKTG